MHSSLSTLLLSALLFSQTSATKADPCPDLKLDLIFVFDRSDSVYDAGYDNWEAEINFAQSIVNGALPDDTRVAAVTINGCPSGGTFEECQQTDYALLKLWDLTEFGTPNDHTEVYQKLETFNTKLNAESVLGKWGRTWTDEAMNIALKEFKEHSPQELDRQKMMIVLTDGKPYPENAGHEPCIASQGYVSDTLRELREMSVDIFVVAIDASETDVDEYFKCMVTDESTRYFEAGQFEQLNDIVGSINPMRKCTTDPTMDPTPAPTKWPTRKPKTPCPTTALPTRAPTKKPTHMHWPTKKPTKYPTKSPSTVSPTLDPTSSPTTTKPTRGPTKYPTASPTTKSPTHWPTKSPNTASPTSTPTKPKTPSPTTALPTRAPTKKYTHWPTKSPSTLSPTTAKPTSSPTKMSTHWPTKSPNTASPTATPTKPKTPCPTSTSLPTQSPLLAPTASPTIERCYDTSMHNPCTSQNIKAGQFYHQSCSGCCHFIQCDESGEAFDRPCSPGTYWNQKLLTCDHNNGHCMDHTCRQPTPEPTPVPTMVVQTPKPTEVTETECYNRHGKNPCTAENRARGLYYFQSCDSCCHFIQCDDFGQAFDMPCAAGTYWDQSVLTCNHNYGQCSDGMCVDLTPMPTKAKVKTVWPTRSPIPAPTQSPTKKHWYSNQY